MAVGERESLEIKASEIQLSEKAPPDLPYGPMNLLIEEMGQYGWRIPPFDESLGWEPEPVVAEWEGFCVSALEGENSLWQSAKKALGFDSEETRTILEGAQRGFFALRNGNFDLDLDLIWDINRARRLVRALSLSDEEFSRIQNSSSKFRV